METGTVFSNAGARERQLPILPVMQTGTSGARLSSLKVLDKSTIYSYFAN
jgi:hypothetical protein